MPKYFPPFYKIYLLFSIQIIKYNYKISITLHIYPFLFNTFVFLACLWCEFSQKQLYIPRAFFKLDLLSHGRLQRKLREILFIAKIFFRELSKEKSVTVA